MLQDIDKVKEMIKRFSMLHDESIEVRERLQQLKERAIAIEAEMTEIRNYLYRDRSRESIQDVSLILNTMIQEDETGKFRESVNELKEIIELWLKDYYHYIRYGVNHLPSSQKKT